SPVYSVRMYYYGARYYEPRECRFYGVDPMMEKYPNLGGHVYCGNNPVLFVDSDGSDYGVSVNMKNKTITISQTFYTDGTKKTGDLMNNAADYFNNQSGKFALRTKDGDFSIIYDVKVVKGGDSDSNYDKAYKDNTANYVETDYGSEGALTIAGDYGSTKEGGDYVRMSNSEIVDDKIYQHEVMHSQGASHEAIGTQGKTLNKKVVAGTLDYASKNCKNFNIKVLNGNESYQLKTKNTQDQPKVVYSGEQVKFKGEVINVQ
ncbi:MAG: hypothetical protein JXB49_04350, partial [Bacteroidales bacterium]|nr:hypothetical protein [Bacteroidales bacterium]